MYTHTHTHGILYRIKSKIKEPDELLKNILSKITKNDIFAIITVFVLGLINNFTFFTTEGIAPDALSYGNFGIAGKWEISLGRFGIRFVNMLRFGLINKFIIILICLFFLAIAVIIIMRIFQIKSKTMIFFVAALVSLAPQFTETYMFIYCADAYCLAFFLSALAVLFMKKAEIKWYYYVLASICVIIVCSLYQAYLGVIIGLIIMLLIYHLLNNTSAKEVGIKTLKYMAVTFVGIILYYLLLKIIISVLEISLASYKGANSLGINTILSLPKTIMQTYKDFFNFFFTDKIINNTYWKRIIINAILFAISGISLVYILFKNKYDKKMLRVLLVIGLLVLFPIGISVMNLIAPDTKINLVTGPGLITTIIMIVIIYKKLNTTCLENIIKYVYIGILLVLTVTFILENNFTYMCRQETFENYYVVSNNIYNRVTELDEYSNDKKWMFSNVIKFKNKDSNKANGFISNDNETWNNYGGTLQNRNYFEKYLGIKIQMCTRKEYDEIIKTEEFKQMPIYPNPGSIKIINDIIVIKVSDKTF